MAERDQAIRDLTSMASPLERQRPSMPKTEAFMTAQRKEMPGYVGPQEISPVLQELRTAEETAATKAGESEIAVEEEKRKERGIEAGMKRGLVEKQATEIKAMPERQQLMAKREELANAAFAPTRDNFNDIAGLFSIIGVIGVAMGGGGKGAALQAMNAMNGMVEGYRRGRADLYKQQLTEFDRSVKTMQQQISTLEKAYTEAMNLKALDRQAGELRIQELLAASDSPVLKAMRDRQGDVAALNLIRNTVKDVSTVATMQNTLQAAADARAAKAAERAAAAAQKNIQLVQTPQGLRTIDVGTVPRATTEEMAAATPFKGGGKGGGLKADAKERNAYISDNVLLADINDMKNDLKNPRLYEQIRQYRIEAFLSEEAKVLDQLLSEEIPRELQVFLTKVRDVRNNYYLDKSGKAVTGGEALRNYGTVPQGGDSPERMQDKFDGLAGRVQRTISIRQQMYGLPPIKVKAGDKTNINAGDEIPLRFNTEEEVDEANLDPGTLVIVGNRRGRVQPKQTQ
jgi:hypothetical protein